MSIPEGGGFLLECINIYHNVVQNPYFYFCYSESIRFFHNAEKTGTRISGFRSFGRSVGIRTRSTMRFAQVLRQIKMQEASGSL